MLLSIKIKLELKKLIIKKKEEIEEEKITRKKGDFENLKINLQYNGTNSFIYVPIYKNIKYLKKLIKKKI